MPAGRPTKMTDARIAKLEEAFLWGCSDAEACLVADIDKATLYRYQQENPEFCDRKENLKSNPVMLARKVTVDALNDNDRAMANKVLDRKEGQKHIIEGGDNPVKLDTPWNITGVRAHEG